MAGRNQPCSCGSGKKFKHCCMNKPKNEFREQLKEQEKSPEQKHKDMIALETERAGPEEMKKRDRQLLLVELRGMKKSVEMDKEYFDNVVKYMDKVISEIAALPLSERQGAVLESLRKQRENTLQNGSRIKFSPINQVMLSLLEGEI